METTLLDILTYLCGLQKVDLCSWEGWERPNSDIPEQFRGVWYVHDMKGNAVVTIDLNLLASTTANSQESFYAIDTWRNYQSVLNSLAGVKLWLIALLLQIRSDVDATTLEIKWSLLRGLIPLPFRSPSATTEDPDTMVRSIVNSSGKVLARYHILRVVDAAGQKTRHFHTMLHSVGPYALLKPHQVKSKL